MPLSHARQKLEAQNQLYVFERSIAKCLADAQDCLARSNSRPALLHLRRTGHEIFNYEQRYGPIPGEHVYSPQNGIRGIRPVWAQLAALMLRQANTSVAPPAPWRTRFALLRDAGFAIDQAGGFDAEGSGLAVGDWDRAVARARLNRRSLSRLNSLRQSLLELKIEV